MSEMTPMFDAVDSPELSPTLDFDSQAEGHDNSQSPKKRTRKAATPAPAAAETANGGQNSKIRLALGLEGKSAWFSEEIKRRGIKDYEWGHVIAEALQQVPDSFWEHKLEELTPLEFRINEALENPELRAKLSALLMGKNLPH